MATKLMYAKVNNTVNNIQTVLDHKHLGKLITEPDVFTTLIDMEVIPIFLCETSKGRYVVVKVDIRKKDFYKNSKSIINTIEKDLHISNNTEMRGSSKENCLPVHTKGYHYYIYNSSKKSDSVLSV